MDLNMVTIQRIFCQHFVFMLTFNFFFMLQSESDSARKNKVNALPGQLGVQTVNT